MDYRYRLQELNRALLAMGITTAPFTLGIDDKNYLDEKEIIKRWSIGDTQGKLASLLTALSPKIVLTVDRTEGDFRACATYDALSAALEEVPVGKFYVASDDGTTVVDCSESMPTLAFRSARDYAAEAYRLMDSRGLYRIVLKDRPCYRLERQTVGEDVQNNDLLENIGFDSLASYDAATPTPIPTPEPTPTSVPTPEPTPDPTAAPTPEPEITETPTETVSAVVEEEVLPSAAPTEAP